MEKISLIKFTSNLKLDKASKGNWEVLWEAYF